MEGEPPPPSLPPAGWYEDPDGTGQQRFWDGGHWTDQLAPPPAPPQPLGARVKDPRNDGLATAGYICALFVPFVGVIIAIMLYGRNDPRGTSILLLSIFVFFVSFIVIASLGSV